MKIGTPLGISTTFWFLVGLLRAISEKLRLPKPIPTKAIHSTKEIAAIVPAHNEELVIHKCIQGLKQSLKPSQIYIISDGSSDNTYKIAKREKCHAIETNPGLGKAKALLHLIETFDLYNKYKFIMIVDADTKIDKTYIPRAFPYFNDPEISAVFPTARIYWPPHIIPHLRFYFIAYRERLDRLLQFFVGYGQAWKYTNANFVTPGFATIYRSEILKQLRIDRPGILVEDFNLAFELHRKKLGVATFHPSFIAWDQHPDNLKDYWHQVHRWNVAFFQTYKAHGFWPSFFWLATTLFSVEIILMALLTLMLPFIVFFKVFPLAVATYPPVATFLELYHALIPISDFTLFEILFSVLWVDYLMTVVIGLMGRKPQFLFYGLFFFFMHIINALILFSSIKQGFFGSSDGRWKSPTRHELTVN